MSGDTAPALKLLGDVDAATCVDGVCAVPQARGVSSAADAGDAAGIDSADSASAVNAD